MIAGFALDGSKWDGIYLAGARMTISSMPGRLITALTRRLPLICVGTVDMALLVQAFLRVCVVTEEIGQWPMSASQHPYRTTSMIYPFRDRTGRTRPATMTGAQYPVSSESPS